jgi:hypothetical protein
VTAGSSFLFGRARELTLLDARLSAAAAGQRGVVLLEGEPGIGKTRLADETCSRARSRDFVVARGAALADAGAPALATWRAVARSLSANLRKVLDGDADGNAASSAVDEARWRRFEAFADALFEHAHDKPLLIMLDDLHDADVASVELLLFWVRNVQHGRWLVLGTLRDAASRVSSANDALLARLAREAETVQVGPLSLDDVAALMRARPSAATGADLTRVYALTRGNPLFVAALLTQSERGQPVSDARVPSSISAALLVRVHALGPLAQATLRAAAVLGAAPTLPALARVLGIANDAVLARLAEPTRAGILLDDSSLRVRFAHPLLREIVLEELPRDERARLHLACAEALEELAAGGLDLPSAETALHRAAALPLGDAALALRGLVHAADEADAQLALEEAAQLRERALDVGVGILPLMAAERCDLALAHARALSRVGARTRARQAAGAAASFARAAGDARRLALAALARGADFELGVTDRALVEDLEAARSALDTRQAGLLARVEARLAAALQPAADPSVPLELARSALARAQAAGDPEALLDTQLSVGAALSDYAPLAERITVARDMVMLAMQTGQRHVALRGHLRLAMDQLELGDLAGSDRSIAAYAQLAATFGPPHYHWTAPLLRAMRAAMHGRFADAERLAEQGAIIGQRSEDPNARVASALQRFAHLRQQGDMDTLRASGELIDQLGGIQGAELWPPIMQASCLARAGEFDEATRILASVPRNHQVFSAEPLMACLWIEAAAYAGVADHAFMAHLRASIASRREEYVCFGVMMLAWDGPYLRYLGLADRALGELDRAIDSFERARSMARALGTEPAALWASFDLAHALEARATPADRERSGQLVSELEPAAARLEMPALQRRVQLLRARAGAAALVHSVPTSREGPRLQLEGETWSVLWGERSLRLKDSRGLRLLERLMREPGRELHVLELIGSADQRAAGDAGEVLDSQAIRVYRERAAELRQDIAAATADHDLARLTPMRAELEAIAEQLAQGVGLGGRARRAGAASERARVNVQRRLKDAIERIRSLDPELGAELERRVCTGTFCSYRA